MSLRILLAVLLLVCGAATARAEKTLLWGIQRDCQPDEGITRAVEEQLISAAFAVTRVGQPGPADPPASAAANLLRSCPAAQGRLLGGVVTASQGLTRFRLWLVDLSSKQIATLDDYCQDCGDLATRVATRAGALVDKPHFAAVASATPSYCQAETAAPVLANRSKKVFVVVYGEPKAHAAIWNGLKQALVEGAREPVQARAESKTFGLGELHKILGKESKGQVLGVEVTAGGANVWVFDGVTEQTQTEHLECGNCDKEELGRRVVKLASFVLDHCFDPQCPEAERDKPARPPAEACQPMAELQCHGAVPLRGFGAPAVASIDPKTAKAIKGLAWGAFAATAATAIGLFAANAAGAGTQKDATGLLVAGGLWQPAWTAAGISIGIAGIAIPITILVDRAARKGQTTTRSSQVLDGPRIQCPN